MGLFDGIEKAPTSYASNYVKAGRYIMMIRSATRGEDRFGIGYVAVNLTVLEQINVDNVEEPSPPGAHVVDIYKKDKDLFLSNIKGLIAGAFAEDPEKIKPEHTYKLIPDMDDKDAAQPMAGIVVEMDCVDAISQKTGKPYVRKNYVRPVPVEEVLDRIDEEDLKKYLSKHEFETLMASVEDDDEE